MRYFAILFILSSSQCMAQKSYDATLSLRIEQIRGLDYYDDKIVTANDTIDYHDLSYPYWKSYDTYYEDDVVKYEYCSYVALKETKGEKPGTSSTIWRVVGGPHPYLFLRDTAKLEDLRKLLPDRHPYVRAYAFGALSYRTRDDMFPVIMDNMNDTTVITVIRGDSGDSAYPAELMIVYHLDHLSKKQKLELKGLIATAYPHFRYCRRFLD